MKQVLVAVVVMWYVVLLEQCTSFAWNLFDSSSSKMIYDTTKSLVEAPEQATRTYVASDIIGLPHSTLNSQSGVFNCNDLKQSKIAFEKVNDDYCDCPNGRDEPGTSACSGPGRIPPTEINILPGFYCPNVGYKSVYIPFSRVNDGLCDCCDGSDEGVIDEQKQFISKCDNTCHNLGHEYRKTKKEEEYARTEGRRKREEYISAGKIGIQKINKEILDRNRKVSSLKTDLESLEINIKEIEGQIRNERKSKTQDEKALLSARIRELQLDMFPKEDLQRLMVKIAAISGLGKKLEQSLAGIASEIGIATSPRWLEDDEPIDPAAFVGTKAGTDLKINKEDCKDHEKIHDTNELYKSIADDDDEDSAGYDAEAGDLSQHYYDEAEMESEYEQEREREASSLHDDTPKTVRKELTAKEGISSLETEEEIVSSPALEEMKAKILEIKSNIRKEEIELKDLEKSKGLDFGPDMVLFSLKDQCFKKQVDKYKYEVCIFGKAKQDSINLGTHETFDQTKKEISFTKGTKCFNGPYRSLTLKLKCGGVEELGDISEPSMCQYEAEFTTPVICL